MGETKDTLIIVLCDTQSILKKVVVFKHQTTSYYDSFPKYLI